MIVPEIKHRSIRSLYNLGRDRAHVFIDIRSCQPLLNIFKYTKTRNLTSFFSCFKYRFVVREHIVIIVSEQHIISDYLRTVSFSQRDFSIPKLNLKWLQISIVFPTETNVTRESGKVLIKKTICCRLRPAVVFS